MKGLLQCAILMVLLLTGCNENSPIRFSQNSAAGASRAETEILAMSQRELDVCRLRLDSGSPLDSFSPSTSSPSSSGSSRQAEEAAWQNALSVEDRIFGNDGGGAQENDAETFSSGGGGFSDQREGIAGVDVLRRDASSYSVQVSSSSSNLATLYTRGVARVTRNIQGGSSPRVEIIDSATVNLAYNLSKVRDRWQCTSFSADVVETLTGSPQRASSGGSNNDDGRIGW